MNQATTRCGEYHVTRARLVYTQGSELRTQTVRLALVVLAMIGLAYWLGGT